jgi:hypothetical protein
LPVISATPMLEKKRFVLTFRPQSHLVTVIIARPRLHLRPHV